MNKEARDYMNEKVCLYDSLKDTVWWLNHAKGHAKESIVIGGVSIGSRCRKEVANHLADAVISAVSQEIQEIERQMEEI